MSVPKSLLDSIDELVLRHVKSSKGFEDQSMINPLTPTDSVAALALARRITRSRDFDCGLAVAPEGHVYGFFFERFQLPILSVHVDYPPRRCTLLDDMGQLQNRKVLILEDDVASGTTLRLVLDALEDFAPASLSLYLGRAKNSQALEYIDDRIDRLIIAEDFLQPDQRACYEREFMHEFQSEN